MPSFVLQQIEGIFLFIKEQNSNTFVCIIFVYLNISNNEEKVSLYFVFTFYANWFCSEFVVAGLLFI